ncbi:MAG: hypothetical protein RL481_2040 [Pseudomonadota bacterium]|jgi:hypothetical protein
MLQTPPPLDQTALRLGYAGLLPQAFALILLLEGESMAWIATAGGYAYAALIFSFLGGMWWTFAMLNDGAPRWIYGAAIAPSLIALATFLPWTWGWEWPGPSLLVLSISLLLSPKVDGAIARAVAVPDGWLRLRLHLSLGLGILTAALAMAALAQL